MTTQYAAYNSAFSLLLHMSPARGMHPWEIGNSLHMQSRTVTPAPSLSGILISCVSNTVKEAPQHINSVHGLVGQACVVRLPRVRLKFPQEVQNEAFEYAGSNSMVKQSARSTAW